MPFSPDEIATKQFVVTLRGYDRAEVDAFLRALANDQARLLQRIRDLESAGPAGAADGLDGGADADAAALLDEALEKLRSLRRQLRR